MIITIDGPAGTGKTTVAKLVAERLGMSYFDTGALYRAVTYMLMQGKVDISDKAKKQQLLDSLQFDIQEIGGVKKYFVNKSDVTEALRSKEVTQKVSLVAADGDVRVKLVELQRTFGKSKNAVFEGRDLGSVVFPEADLKVFLTARPAVRAERRYLEVKDKIHNATQEEILKEILERDHFDSTRELSPLKQTDDAHLIDTSDLSLEEVIQKVLLLVPQKRK